MQKEIKSPTWINKRCEDTRPRQLIWRGTTFFLHPCCLCGRADAGHGEMIENISIWICSECKKKYAYEDKKKVISYYHKHNRYPLPEKEMVIIE